MRAPLSFRGHASEGTFLDPYNEDEDQEYHHFPRSRSSGARTRPRRGLQRRPAIENLRVYGTKVRLDVKPRRLPHGERWPDLNDILSMQGGQEHGPDHHCNLAKTSCDDWIADAEYASDDFDHDLHQAKRLKEWHSSNDDHGSSIGDDEDDKKKEGYSLHQSLQNPGQHQFEAPVMSNASSIATASETSSFSCSSCSISRIAEEVFFARHILPGAAKLVEVGSRSSKVGGSGSAGGGGGGGGGTMSFRASDSYNSGIQSSSDNSLGQLVTPTIDTNANIINNGSGDSVDVKKQHEPVKQFPRVIRIIRKHSVSTLFSLDDIDADDGDEQQPIYEMAYASRVRKVPRLSYQADEGRDATGGGGGRGGEVKNIWRQIDVKPPRTLRTQTPRNTRWPFRAELPDPARHDCIAAWARGVQPGEPKLPDWEQTKYRDF